ncbi:MAG: undecaprenyldiphospho-muramoylpentapeptide beta-N-acetylglucosaminyltransferase [Streptococcaceae bacterium]|nr:undecaprenyldiphospho-muramoylpentapeptide beta-N-acetylglucosaminyltransferase [Streptococcaceae bacterium]MCL2858237.1 undecaprenyldiphospho-muramoylpentapeptide beta-N-acetylglucosaminyltransferase [Streptococcaceae bacterium]
MKIIVTGGGTGGHIYPALALINYLQTVESDLKVLYIGTEKGLESKIVPEAGIDFQSIDIQGFRRSLSLSNFNTIRKFFKSTSQAKKIIQNFKPDVVLGTGGYVAGPVLYAASKLNIPTVIHEQNSIPGITNKFLGKRVSKITLAFEEAQHYFPKEKTSYVGNPRSQELVMMTKSNLLVSQFGLSADKKTVLIFGGSRGAMTINDAVLETLPVFKNTDYQVIYASGNIYYDENQSIFEKYNQEKNIVIRPFLNNMLEILRNSDLIISRAGATTLAEITAIGLPAVLIPSPNVTADHQTKNAQALVNHGAAMMISDSEFDGKSLLSSISEIFADQTKYEKMSQASKEMGITDASQRLYTLIKEIIQ